jgi:hypothetical protein
MSDFTGNENGRAEGTGAPAGVLEETVAFDFDKIEDAALVVSETPSKHDPDAIDAHASAGHELIPLRHWQAKDKEGKPAGKSPIGSWRREPALLPADACKRMLSGANVGVRLRDIDLVIDVDPRNFKAGDDPLARLLKDFVLDDAPFVLTGGGGRHLYFRKPANLAIEHGLPEYRGVEFASLGRYVVAAGSVHPNGSPYLLDDDPLARSLSEAPEATTALLDAIAKRSVEAPTDARGEITPEQLEKLLSKLDVMKFHRLHDDWLAIMMSCHYGTRGAGVDEFVAWSISDPDYADDEARIRARWQRLELKPNGVKLGTLLKALVDAGHGAWIEEVLRSSPEDDFDDAPEMPRSVGDLALARMNRNHFTVLHGGKYLVGRERNHPTLGHVEVEWFSSGAISAHFDSRTVEIEDGKQKALGSWWVKHPRRRQYEGVVFDPSPNRTLALQPLAGLVGRGEGGRLVAAEAVAQGCSVSGRY